MGVADKQSNFVSKLQQRVSTLLETIRDLRAMRTEFNLAGYSGAMLPAAFAGENDHLAHADIVAAIQSLASLGDALDANNGQVMAVLFKIPRA